MNLSVAMATYNEEENIKRCIDSFRSIADEIIVVDGNSTDKTVEIAESLGAKVTITDNPQIFHINKQKAINKCHGQWILQLDADEVVSKPLAGEIIKIINNSKVQANGYWLPRKNWFITKFLTKGGQYPDYTLRLYKRGKGSLPQKDVHEQAVVEGKVGYLKNPLLHYPYKNFGQYLLKWNRYNDLLAEKIKGEVKGKSFILNLFLVVFYLVMRPAHWFLTTYVRHKGFVDGWDGFLFSFFSALRFPASYIKYLAYKL